MNYFYKRLFLMVFMGVAGLAIFFVFWLGEKENEKLYTYSSKLTSLNRILQNLGYGGAIHSFKNYILRGDKAYYDRSMRSFVFADTLVKRYLEKEGATKKEREALKGVLSVIKSYIKNLDIAKNRIANHAEIGSIVDRRVKVNDDIALRSILQLIDFLESEIKRVQESFFIQKVLIYLFLLALFLFKYLMHSKELHGLENVNNRLSVANDELLQFAYRASHDLKSPLVTIKGLADFMEEDLRSGQIEEVQQNIFEIKSLAKKLEGLVLGILDMARGDLTNLDREKVHFEQIVEDIIKSHQHISKKNNVSIIREISVSRDHFIHQSGVIQIISNLVVNAIKYCNYDIENRFVKIKIDEFNEGICLQVKDNGIGIPAEKKSDVYLMFKKFHSNKSLGSGLGMYMVKKVVDQMNGNITYDSSAQGTHFNVYIPTGRQK